MSTKWIEGKALSKIEQEGFNKFCNEVREFNLSDTSLKILYNRDINTYQKVKNHLYMELHEIHDPRLFKDSDKFLEGMLKAIKENHKIVIMGDYDCDGINATAIAMLGLQGLGVDVDFYINNRFIEGYGFTTLSLENILIEYPDVKTILTVDNGIVSYDAVNLANEKGIQVIITDHHEPKVDGTVPNSFAVVDHKRKDCPYPFKELCGAGVIFKLLMLLYWELDKDLDDVYDLLDFVAVATVGDVVSITDENRVFLKQGLSLLRNDHRLFFKVLNKKMDIKQIDEETIGFKYSPAINAIGRLDGCPSIVVRAMISNDVEFVNEICDQMVATNNHRKDLTLEQVNKSEELLLQQGVDDVIVVYNEDFDEGIVGLIAGKLCERYYRPVVALTKHGDVIKGSARSIPGFDVKDSFDYCAELLLGYGGHPQAGGVSLKFENLDKFKAKLNEYAKIHLTEETTNKKVYFDNVLGINDINGNILDEINELRPYGQGFRKPIFGLRFEVDDNGFYENMAKNVLKLRAKNKVYVLGFDNKQQYIDLGRPKYIALLGCPSINIWEGNISYQFMLHEDCIKSYKKMNA